jgi:CHASE2 domain-containing sensor protein
MKGHIVMLGGAFEASRDSHASPFEDHAYGVYIQAGIIAADLAHQQIEPVAWWIFLLIDLALGVALVVAGWFLDFRSSLAITAGALILVLLGSLLLYQQFKIYLSFAPVVAGVGVHFLVEHLREHWKFPLKITPVPKAVSTARRPGKARRRRGRA